MKQLSGEIEKNMVESIKTRTVLKTIAKWTLPFGLYTLVLNRMHALSEPKQQNEMLPIVQRNITYKDIHKGKRCFIFCNGPSVNKQNLLPLKDEIVFSVSSGYLHKDYHVINPRYHLVPRVIYEGSPFTEDVAKKWFSEMDSKLGDAEIFLSVTEKELVERNNLFTNKKVNYIYFDNDSPIDRVEPIDIAVGSPCVQSVPIMCLIVAMYMGFKEVYLLGTDHDSFRTGDYKYSYTPTVFAERNFNIEGDKVQSLYEELRGCAILWEQYRAMRKIADANKITILNATHGGALDEFERVNLDEVLGTSPKDSM
jgi:hypothetical protein